jgi:WD40 repeat protein
MDIAIASSRGVLVGKLVDSFGPLVVRIEAPMDRPAICFSPDGSRLFIGRGKTLTANDPNDLGVIQEFVGHTDDIDDVLSSHDRLASVSSMGQLRIWDTESCTCLFVFENVGSCLNYLDFSPKGSLAVYHRIRRGVCIFNVYTGETEFIRNYMAFGPLKYLPNGNLVLKGIRGLIVLNLETGQSLNIPVRGINQNVDVSEDGSLIVFSVKMGHIQLWSLSENRIIGSHNFGSYIVELRFLTGMKVLAILVDGLAVHDFDTKTTSILNKRKYSRHTSTVRPMNVLL